MDLGELLPDRPLTRREILARVRERQDAAVALLAEAYEHPLRFRRNRKLRSQARFELKSAGRWLDSLPPPTKRERERAAYGIGAFGRMP